MLPFNKLLRYRFTSLHATFEITLPWDVDQFGWGCMQMSHSPDHLKAQKIIKHESEWIS